MYGKRGNSDLQGLKVFASSFPEKTFKGMLASGPRYSLRDAFPNARYAMLSMGVSLKMALVPYLEVASDKNPKSNPSGDYMPTLSADR